MKILIINGPNLGNIGEREPEIYGHEDFSNYLENLRSTFKDVEISYFQSHEQGKLVERLYCAASENFSGIVLNAGAYTHTSYCLRDAVAAINVPTVLVHISNVYAREHFRYTNIIAGKCKGVITGFGLESYKLAIASFLFNT